MLSQMKCLDMVAINIILLMIKQEHIEKLERSHTRNLNYSDMSFTSIQLFFILTRSSMLCRI